MVKTFRSEDAEFDLQIEYPTYSDAAWPTTRPSVFPLPRLLPYEHAKQLYAAQHAYIGTIFSFLSPTVFGEHIHQIYSKRLDLSDPETCLIYCQVLLMFAYGQMYSINQWTGNDGPPGFSYFMQALKFLPNIHEEGSVLFVEVLSLIGYFMQNLNRRDAASLYIGLALRMAISLGLHQEVSDPALDEMEREYRRRLWWSVYSMDRILCAKSGNPITIADGDIGVNHPSRMPAIEPEVSSVTVLYHYTELSRILGNIMESVYRKSRKIGSKLVESVQTIMGDLALWLRNLPSPLRLDFNKLDKELSRESVSMFLHYYQCINMTARPLLFHVVQKRLQDLSRSGMATADWHEGLSQTTIAVIEACISAARASTTILAAAAKQNLVATYGFMDGDDAFSAALILVMVSIAFPPTPREHEAMTQALEVLRGMADRGNGHIGARRQSLLNLQTMINKVPSAHPIIATSTTPMFEAGLDPLPAPGDTFTGCGDLGTADNGNSTVEDAGGSGLAGLFPSLDPSAACNMPLSDLGDTTEDMSLWEEVYGNADLGMDFDWNEATRIAKGYGDG
ncbi:Transcriptional activator [Neonectria punicea]|uniref:Transcriptional activator n=1 Tax=Neonectria punicea TaxID=979145 RepID=A0ABR1GR29_9HYPO